MSEESHPLPTWTSDTLCHYNRGDSLSIHLGLTHDECVLFEPANIVLPHGIVTGLVGTNGAGKTSLARVIASKTLPKFPQDLTIEYVSSAEDESLYDILPTSGDMGSLTPTDYVRAQVDAKIYGIRAEIERLETTLADDDDVEKTANRLAQLYDQEDALVTSSNREIESSIRELGLASHLDKTLDKLSCGWQYKCRLASGLLTHPDMLILDEPSFIDADSSQWLGRKIQELTTVNAIVLLISHKERLLESLCGRILYINSANRTLSSFHCGYHTFRETVSSQASHAQRTVAEATLKTTAAQESLRQLQSQLHRRERTLKAKTTQNSDQRFIKGKNKEAKQKADRSAASKVKQLKKEARDMEEMQRQAQRERVKPIQIDGVQAEGPLVTLDQVAVAYEDDRYLFSYLDARLEATDHILLCGPNGVGKSTLVKLILGQLEATDGRVVRRQGGPVLYFSQTAPSDLTRLHGRESAVAYLGEDLTETRARQHLGNFGLTNDLTLRPIATLSAGQRVRLWLAKELLLNPKPSLLVMDEISENVDVETRQSLAKTLNDFVGATLVVSHDTDFCEDYRPTQIWRLGLHGVQIEFR